MVMVMDVMVMVFDVMIRLYAYYVVSVVNWVVVYCSNIPHVQAFHHDTCVCGVSDL